MEGGIISVRVIGLSCKEGKNESQFAQPRGVCVNHETKELFVVDCNNHRIQVYHLTSLAFIRQIGRGVQSSGPGGFMYPVGICMDDANQIFVADTNNHRVVVFNHLTGTYLRSIGSHGPTPGSFNCPYGVCVDRSTGLLYVADYENNRVQVFNKETGAVVAVIGNGSGSGPGEFNQPIDVCVDEENQNLLVADYSNNRVQVFNKTTGVFERFVGDLTGPNAFSGPRSIYINKEVGLIFISDRENHRIQMYNKNTYEFIRFIGNNIGIGLGQFNRPMEICCDNEEGVLIVVDGYNHRVQVIEIPELQVERQRIKNAKKSGENMVTSMPTQVRPSRQVVSVLNQPLHTYERKKICNSFSLWYFAKLGDVYDNIVCEVEDHDDVELSLESIDLTFDHKPPMNDLCTTQGNLFLKMLDDLVPLAFETGSLILLTPTIVGMQALLQKGWMPTHISTGSISGMFGILQDEKVGQATQEHTQVITGIVQLLKSAIRNNEDARNFVFALLTTALRNPVVFCQPENLNPSNYSDQYSAKHILILLAYFEIFESFLSNSHQESLTSTEGGAPTTSVSKLKNHSSTAATSEISVYIMNFILGVELSQFIVDYTKSTETSGNKVLSSNVAKTSSAKTHVSIASTLISVLETLIILDTSRYSITSHYSDYQIARKQYLKACSQHVQHLEQNQNLLGKHREKKTRGGRNVWDGSSPFQIGDLVDCMDREKVWFESMIVDVVSDGSVKVHFMGWGAKWDDMISVPEIPIRVAILNSKTVNWRSELFEGGLIEIKCNDDMVNQKWMWGRIMKLNLDDDWVEIAYSFSTEPLVVKKAWLYGETICPVGMHTKDKSKNAASSIIKPGKKVDQILKEKLATSSMADEVVFYDFEDDYLEIDEEVHDKNIDSYFLKAKHLHTFDSSFFNIPHLAFTSLTKEIIASVGDCVNGNSPADSFIEEEAPIISDIMRTLFRATSPKLFLECVIKPIYFQAGLRAKILISSISSCSLTHEWNWIEVLQLSDQLTNLIATYHTILTKIFSPIFSHTTVVFINERIRSTINRCGFTPIANQIIQSCAHSPTLLVQAIQPLLSSEKFHSSSIQARKFIRLIFSSASTKEVNLLLDLVEKHFIRKDCHHLLHSLSSGESVVVRIETLLATYDCLGSQYSKHTMEHHRLLCAVERILIDESLLLSVSESKSIAKVLSVFVNNCLSKHKIGMEDSCEYEDMPLQSLERLITIAKMLFTNEELRHFFMKYYTYDLSLRLVQNNFMSLPVERKMVFDFDVEAGVALLDDINRSARVMRSFGTYLLNKIDGDSSGNKFFSFVRQGGMFSVLVGNMWNWKQLSNTTSTFSNLPLPALLQEARSEFEAFYSTNAVSVETEDEESSSTLAKRKLYWCNGLGSITLDCWLRNKKVSTVVVNEPQYCVIDCIANASTTSMTLADLSFQLNLPLETVSEVVVSLLTSSPKILSIQDKATLHKQVSSAIVHRSILCAKSEISFEDIQLRNRGSYSVQSQGERNDVVPLNVHYMHQSEHTTDESNTWRAVRVDAQVLRILKKQQALYPSTKGCTLEQIVNKVLPSLRSSFSYVLFYEKDIEESCQRLVKQGILDRDLTSTKEIFTYLFISSKQEGDGSIKTVVSVNSESNLSKIISSCIEISSLAVEEQPQEDLAIGESKEESTKTLENSCDQLLLTIAKLQPFPAAFTLSSQREDFAKQISQTATGLVLFVSSVITQLHYLIADNFPSPFLGSLDAFMHNAKLLAQQPSKELLDCVSLFIFTKLPQNVIDSILTVFVSLVDKKGVDAKTNTTLQHILMHGVSLASWSQLMALWTYSFTSKESVESKFTENEQFSTSLTLSQIFMNSISIKDVPQSKIRVGVRSTKEKANKEKEEIHVVDLSKPTHLTLNTLLQQVTKQCAAYVGVQEYEKEMSFDASTDGYSIDDINFLTEATFSFMMQDLHSNIVDCIWWKTPLQTNLQSVTQQAIRVSQEVLKNPIVSSLSSSAPSDDIDAEPSIQSYENNLQKLAQMMKVPIEEASLLLSLSDWDTLHLLDNWFSASQPEQLIAHARKFKRQQIQDGKDLQIRCPFCQQNYPMDRMVYASTCGHSACHDCWNSHIDSYHISEEHFPAIPCIQNSHQPATCSCWLSTDMIATCLSIDNSVISSKLVHAHRLIYDKNHSIDVVNITATTSTTTNTSTLAKCKYCRTYECLPSLSVNKTHSRLHETSLYGYFHGHNKKQIDEIQSTLDALQAELKYCRLRDDLDNILLRWQYWNHVLECELLADHCQKLLVLSDSSLELTQLMRWQESFLDFPKVNTPKIEELHQVRFLRVHINTLFEKLVRNMGDDHQEQHCRVSSLYLKDIHRLNSHRNAFGDLNVTYLTCLVQPRAMEMSMQLNLVKLQTNMQLLRQCEHIPREDIILKMKDLLDAVEGLNQQDRFMLSSLERTSGTTVVDFQAVATVAEALEYMISDPDSFVIMLAVAKAYFELILHILSHSHTRAQQTSMTQDQHYINRTWQSLQQMLCSAIELYDHSALNIIYNCLKVFQYYLKVMRKLNVVNVMWEQDQRILQILSSKLQSYKDLVEVAECGSALEKMEEILEYCKTVAQLTTNFDANVDCLPNSLLDLLFASLKLTISLQTKSLAVPERAWEVTFVNCLQCALLFSTYDTSHYKNTPLEVSLNNFSDKMWKNSDIFFSLLMKTLRKVALQTSAKKDNHILTHDHMRRHFGLLCSCIVAFTTSSTQQDTKMFNHGFDHFQEAITHLLEWKWTTTSNAKPTASQSQHNFDLVNLVMKIITSYCAHLTEESRSKFKSEIIYEKLRYIREEVKLLFKEATSLSRRLQSHWCQHHVDECLEVVNKLRAPKPRARDAQSPNRDSLRSPPPTRTNSFPPTNANETQMLNILFNEVLARNQTRAQDGNNNNAENNQVPMRTLLGQLLNYTNAVQNIEQRMQQEIQAMNHPMQMPMAAMMLMRRETDEQNRRELLRGAGNNNNNLAMTDRLRDSDDDSSDDHHSRSDSSDSSNDSEDF